MSKQYKLINLETKEEFICEKVVIEGMDYYSIKGDIKFGDYVTNGFMVWLWKDNTSLLGIKKVVASTNPSIDTPKITDEAYYLSQKASIVDRAKYDLGYMVGFNMAKGKYPFTEDDLEEFYIWKDENRWFTFSNGKWNYTFEHGTSISEDAYELRYRKTTKELLDIWQEQRIETIYFK